MSIDPDKSPTDKRLYDERGFVVIRECLEGADLANLQAELDRYVRDVVPTLPDTGAFYQDRARPETLKQMQHMEGDPFFRDYATNAKWTALAEKLVGEPVDEGRTEWFNKPP